MPNGISAGLDAIGYVQVRKKHRKKRGETTTFLMVSFHMIHEEYPGRGKTIISSDFLKRKSEFFEEGLKDKKK